MDPDGSPRIAAGSGETMPEPAPSAGKGSSGGQAKPSLPQRVKETRDALLALVREVDAPAADWVDEVRHARPPKPSVVVVGETNRGKSSLVNALIGQPGLSPVDIDVITGTYLRFEHGAEWTATAQVTGQDERTIDVAELSRWVCPDGDRPDELAPPRWVRVTAPLEPLTGLTFVDTPGVGGLNSMHGELAKEAAVAATALLFVVDASTPLTRGELDFLHDVGDRVETVVFAMTKTDQYRGWREVWQADQRLLAEHAPRFADAACHPVSARMDEIAANTPDESTAQLVRERSGIAQLRSECERLIAGRGAMLGEANTLRALSTVLDELVVTLTAEQRTLNAGEQEAQALRARRDELSTARRSSTRGWQVRLRGEIQRTRVETSHEVTHEMREVQSWFRRTIEAADRSRLAGLPFEVDAALQSVSSRVASALSARLSAVTETSLAELFSTAELDVIRSQFARGVQPPVALRPPDKRPSTAEDKLLVFMGVSGGLGVGRAAALPLAGLGVGVLNPIVLPVTIVLGLGTGWWLARTRKHTADKQHLKQWLTEAIADARSTLDRLVAEQLIEAEQQLSFALDDALSRRIEGIERELREVDRALKMDVAERGRASRRVEQRLGEARSGKDNVEQLLGSMRELRDG